MDEKEILSPALYFLGWQEISLYPQVIKKAASTEAAFLIRTGRKQMQQLQILSQ